MFDVFRLFTEEEELTSSLFLKSVRPSDSGYYSCKAGTSQAVIFLTVIGTTIHPKKNHYDKPTFFLIYYM